MNRTEKSAEIEVLKNKFAKAPLMILADYKGLKVEQFNRLRRKLEEKDSSVKVVKNRLAKIAIQGTEWAQLSDHFKGTTSVTTAGSDPVGPAKVFTEFAKDNEVVKFKAGFMAGKVLSIREIEALAKLPSREELIAKMLGSMMAPARNLVNVLAQIPRQVVNVLAAVRDKKEKEAN